MITETVLFDPAKRWVPERAVLDALCQRCGDPPYGDDVFNHYFADYCGLARQEKPKRFFEIGVRYGYTIVVMAQALQSLRGRPKCEFFGIDDESYHYRSCDKANENFAIAIPEVEAVCRKWNSITQGMPPDCGMFDLIHIDGNKDYHGRSNDLVIAWPHLRPGGLIILDDARKTCDDGTPGPTYAAAMDFLRQFAESEQNVEWQYNDGNMTHHLYLRKCV